MYLPHAIIVAVTLTGVAQAQDAAWETYRAANTLAQAKAWSAALPKFRAVIEVATEPALRTAAYYGIGLATHAMVQANPDQALACEGVSAIDNFLAAQPPAPRTPTARPSKALTLATSRRAELHGVCEPPPPPPPPADHTAAAWTAGGAGAALIAGGVLVGVAFSDAADVRAKRQMQIAAPDLEDRAQLSLISGYTLLGVGAALGGLAAWMWLRDDDSDVAIRPAGLGIEGRF